MDREYLEDYEQKEKEEYERLVEKRIQNGTFDFEKDRYPPDNRFVKLQKPVAGVSLRGKKISSVLAQVPFCGSLILTLASFPRHLFERFYFKISDIPKIIDFIKDTGKLQIALTDSSKEYEGLDYFDDIFKELNPPMNYRAPMSIFGNKKETRRANDVFFTLGRVKYIDWLKKTTQQIESRSFQIIVNKALVTYIILKLEHYIIIEDIENSMIDDPAKAHELLTICRDFIINPISTLRFDLVNFTLEDIRGSQILPVVYQPETYFPYEIGKFLLRKLTYAPQGLRACYNTIDNYEDYDLQKVQKSLSEAIVGNHPDIVKKSAKELYEILDNVWKDKTIPNRIENIKVGVPFSIAAIGGFAGAIVGGLVGGPEGAVIGGTSGAGMGDFLTRLGFKIGEKTVEKFFAVKGEDVSEKIAKLRTKSYQANVYDFKKKYKDRIVKEKS